MDFSEVFKHTGCLRWSPDGRYLATVVGVRLVIRAADTLEVVQLWPCLDVISLVEWSPDSKNILCALYKRATVQVWAINDPDWTCTIDEGAAGLVNAKWAPDSRHIITFADFQVRLTIWSLVHKTKYAIQMPKFSDAAFAVSNNGKYAVVAERKDCKDYLIVLACENWEVIKHFPVESADLVDVQWSPDDGVLCVQDSLLDYKVLMYTPDGRCVGKYIAYEDGLGVKTVSWDPTGRYLAVGSYDQRARVLDHMTWKKLAMISHPASVPSQAIVFREEERLDAPAGVPPSQYVLADHPVTVPVVKVSADRPNPKMGVGLMKWSHDGRFLATRNDNMPNTLWIWDASSMQQTVVLMHVGPVRSVAWSPIATQLACCLGNGRVYFWTPSGALCVNIPAVGFSASSLVWRSDGKCLLLQDKDRFCVVWPNLAPEEAAPFDASASAASGTGEETATGDSGEEISGE